jgi:hypothetical protein
MVTLRRQRFGAMLNRPVFLLHCSKKGPKRRNTRSVASTCTLARSAEFSDNPAMVDKLLTTNPYCFERKELAQWMSYPMCCALFA